jgi:hypothetical protein
MMIMLANLEGAPSAFVKAIRKNNLALDATSSPK